MSLTNTKNIIGVKTDPYGTPLFTSSFLIFQPLPQFSFLFFLGSFPSSSQLFPSVLQYFPISIQSPVLNSPNAFLRLNKCNPPIYLIPVLYLFLLCVRMNVCVYAFNLSPPPPQIITQVPPCSSSSQWVR